MITEREKAIAGFAWSAGNLGQSMKTMDELIHAADLLGGFDEDFVKRAAAGDCPSEKEILERIVSTATELSKEQS